MNAIIDQQMQGLPPAKFKVGDRVDSRAVGRVAAFFGTVELVRGYVGQSCSGWTYHVRADDGMLWHRSDGDLSVRAAA